MVKNNTSLVKIKTVKIRGATSGNQQVRACHFWMAVKFDHDRPCCARNANHFMAFDDVHAFFGKTVAQNTDKARMVTPHHVTSAFDDGDFNPKPCMRLRHFNTDRTSPNNDEMVRTGAVFENRLIGMIRRAV